MHIHTHMHTRKAPSHTQTPPCTGRQHLCTRPRRSSLCVVAWSHTHTDAHTHTDTQMHIDTHIHTDTHPHTPRPLLAQAGSTFVPDPGVGHCVLLHAHTHTDAHRHTRTHTAHSTQHIDTYTHIHTAPSHTQTPPRTGRQHLCTRPRRWSLCVCMVTHI